MNRTLLLLAFALLAAACASASAETAPTTTTLEASATESSVPQSPSSIPPASTPGAPANTAEETKKPPPDGPEAPDFTTVLASGESYTLSEAVKPVYMVFWAEW